MNTEYQMVTLRAYLNEYDSEDQKKVELSLAKFLEEQRKDAKNKLLSYLVD